MACRPACTKLYLVAVFLSCGLAWSYGDNVSSPERAPEPVAKLQFRVEMCYGLTNQRLQLIDGVLASLFLGAQIILPPNIAFNGAQFLDVDSNLRPLEEMYDLARFRRRIQSLYRDFWCRRRWSRGFALWCLTDLPSVTFENRWDREVNVTDWSPAELLSFGEEALKEGEVLRILGSCESWFKMKVKEGSEFWLNFWKIHEALEFNEEIQDAAERLKVKLVQSFGETARRRAESLGYQEETWRSGYHLVHLRAEEDWRRHCLKWTSYFHKRDNCMNNTFQIGNVLLSEKISPALPVYLATGLSVDEIENLRSQPSMRSFFSIYTVVTKEMLGMKADQGRREFWAAIDFTLSEDAEWFVGNSISSFSAFIMEMRSRSKLPLLPYNGGKMALEEINCLRPKQLNLIPPLRPAIKWIFILPSMRLFDQAYNMTMAAVRSAQRHTKLVPVCVTLADPSSAVLKSLVSMGVRVIYHSPPWMPRAQEIAAKSGTSLEEFVCQWMQIELPMLGFLDEFALHTGTDVLFKGPVTWKHLLGPDHERLAQSLEKHMFGRNFFHEYASGGTGVPKLLSSGGTAKLLNLRGLREKYLQLRRALESDDQAKLQVFQAFPAAQLPETLTSKKGLILRQKS